MIKRVGDRFYCDRCSHTWLQGRETHEPRCPRRRQAKSYRSTRASCVDMCIEARGDAATCAQACAALDKFIAERTKSIRGEHCSCGGSCHCRSVHTKSLTSRKVSIRPRRHLRHKKEFKIAMPHAQATTLPENSSQPFSAQCLRSYREGLRELTA